MFGRTWLLLGMCTMALAAEAGAQPPGPGAAKSPPVAVDLDRATLDVLKDIHNRGAELYNKGEPLGGMRLYEGALLAVRPFLVKHPAIQKIIDDGLAEVARTEGVKIQAFRLHEVIEEVRGKLKEEVKKNDTAKMDPPVEKPNDPPTAKLKEVPMAKAVSGILTYKGKSVGGAEIVFVSLTAADPKVFRVTTGADGSYAIATNPPVGEYAVKIAAGANGPKLPAKYEEFTTSSLKVKVAAGANAFDFNLE